MTYDPGMTEEQLWSEWYERSRAKLQHIGAWHFVMWVHDYPMTDWAGVALFHRHRLTGGPCGAFVLFKKLGPGDERHVWTVHDLRPLTLSPSIVCTRCGDHGFIQQGLWVSA